MEDRLRSMFYKELKENAESKGMIVDYPFVVANEADFYISWLEEKINNLKIDPKHETVDQCCNNCRAISDCPLIWNRNDWNLEDDYCSKYTHHGKPEETP